jgi:AbrB family looped-hinge helix DNA binding protein
MEANIKRTSEIGRVGKRGTVVIPARMRRRLGMAEGDAVLLEEKDGAVVIRPAVTLPVESYSPERVAEFLLNNAVTQEEYAEAVTEVRRLGLDPASIPHEKPAAA